MEALPSLPAPAAGGLKQKIRIFLKCRNLRDLDIISKSDPYVEVWLKNDERSNWLKIGKTETIDNNLNPDFATAFTIDYFFEKTQQIRFEVYDEDVNGRELEGKHQTTISKLVGAKNQTYAGELKVKNPKTKCGSIIVTTDSVKDSNKSVLMSVSCKGLKSKKEFFGLVATNHPILIIKRLRTFEPTSGELKEALKVYQSYINHGTTSPKWNLGEVPLEVICNSDIDLPLAWEVWTYQKSGKHRIYGRVIASVKQMVDQEKVPQDLIRKDGVPYGKITFDRFQLIERPTMVDYFRSGWIVSLSVAIDFTASNGELSNSRSLHYIDPRDPAKMTPYEQAIYQVGNILEPYDSDRMFPVFGFGAKPRYLGINTVSHCFHLNGKENPEVEGVQGILSSYRNALTNGIGLYGPTNFTPCLRTMMNFVSERVQMQEYHIMLYITDGAITDMEETVSTIVEASHLPMSIIIIGVGSADFDRMEQLDSDDALLTDKYGNRASRDIVQFVEFNKYVHDPSYLHEDVLREVPDQVVLYMMNNGIQPNALQHLETGQLDY